MREDQRITVVGLQGSGKTELTKKLIQDIYNNTGRRCLIVDLMDEYDLPASVATICRIKNKAQPVNELETIIQKLIIDPCHKGVSIKKRYAALIVDETPQYWRSAHPLPPCAALLNHTMRHYNIGLICISRRFVQMHVDIAELSHELYIFRQTGANDLKRLSGIAAGLDDAVRQLQKYQYVHVDEERNFRICDPIPL